MLRLLVAYEGPDGSLTTNLTREHEKAWDEFVATLRKHGLQLVNDLDPVDVVGRIEVYEAVAL
jgi:hypothetical protein